MACVFARSDGRAASNSSRLLASLLRSSPSSSLRTLQHQHCFQLFVHICMFVASYPSLLSSISITSSFAAFSSSHCRISLFSAPPDQLSISWSRGQRLMASCELGVERRGLVMQIAKVNWKPDVTTTKCIDQHGHMEARGDCAGHVRITDICGLVASKLSSQKVTSCSKEQDTTQRATCEDTNRRTQSSCDHNEPCDRVHMNDGFRVFVPADAP